MRENEKNYPRKIRSFVRRQRRFSSIEEQEYDLLFQHYGLKLEEIPHFLKESADVVLDIGFGMGESLFEIAEQAYLQNPARDTKFLGVEVHCPGIFQLMKRLNQHHFHHVKIISGDVLDVLEKVPDQSFSKIQIFFPDPWPKKRHHKRRLIRKDTIDIFIKKIKSQGLLEIATDVKDYGEEISALLENHTDMQTILLNEENNGRPLTRFKQKGLQAGRPIMDLCFRKIK